MKLQTIFPLKIYLHLFQLEGYSPQRFLSWWLKHPFTHQLSQKKPLILTFKAKFLLYASRFLFLLFLSLLLLFPSPFCPTQILLITLTFFFITFTPFLFLFLSLLLLKPYEIINKKRVIEKSRRTILNHPHLTTIGITGSYGKTSTKDFLYQILNLHQPTLKTPESYNTIFGIAKTIKLELLSKNHFFICEMGAYKRGEIKTLTHQIPSQYAILTAIGSQHLERFKNIRNTTLAKFELIDTIKPQNVIVNLDNPHIQKHLQLKQYSSVKTYSLINPQANFYVTKYQLTSKGTDFSLKYKNKIYTFSSSLFGTNNLQNLTAAISMALMLNVPSQTIKQALKHIQPSPHRLQLKKINKSILIDNAYSSNEQGFHNIIQDIKKLPGKKALITPGIIELGIQSDTVHQQLGKAIKPIFDQIILVGKNSRTQNLAQTINSLSKTKFISNSENIQPIIQKLSQKFDWILLENDLPDNY